MIAQLPPYLFIGKAQSISASWFDDALRFLAFEAGTERPGANAMIQRLAEVLFIHMVRVWQETEGQEASFAAAVADKNIGRSLQAFHQDPGAKWTVDRLAREGGLSRTVFVERFRRHIGQAPMQYATEWRMQSAHNLLADRDRSIEQIAEAVGYESLAAFSRTFKKVTGVSPGAARRAL